MEAVIVSGGKQYRVREGDVVRLERLPAGQGETVEFRELAWLGGDGAPAGASGTTAGEPGAGRDALSGARVVGQVVSVGRGRKVVVVKFKRRKNYTRRQGHRQGYTAVRITRIELAR